MSETITTVLDSPAFGCVNNTIRLRSGLYLDLADPQPEQFSFGDVAGALSKICRFGAQIDQFYSVAEHCYWCAKVGQREGLSLSVQVALLMHDAAEAFIGDVVKPLKIMLPDYKVVEHRMEAAIANKFGIDVDSCKSAVRKIDMEMLICERRKLFSADNVVWTGENEVRKIEVDIQCFPPEVAEELFTDRARSLAIDVTR